MYPIKGKIARFARTTLAAGLIASAFGAGSALAAEGHVTQLVERQTWSFAGPLGRFDKAQLQRGFKVFKEVCSTCHAAKYFAFRNLAEEGGPGYTEEQAKALAAEYKVKDGPNDEGEMFERPAKPSDRWPSPFANEQAARAAMGGAYPPDLSLMGKGRSVSPGFPGFLIDGFTTYAEGGPDYIYNLLLNYRDEVPHGMTPCGAGQSYNATFAACIGMPKPLADGGVTFDDGAPNRAQDQARDVSAFLMWLAEPHLEARKQMGLKVMLFLIVFAGLLFFVKKKVWANVAH